MRHTESHTDRRHHRRHMMKMRRMAMRRRGGPRFGPPFGGPERGGMMRGFLQENPDVAERLARYGAAQLREEGWSDEDIREHLAHMQERGFLAELDPDTLFD